MLKTFLRNRVTTTVAFVISTAAAGLNGQCYSQEMICVLQENQPEKMADPVDVLTNKGLWPLLLTWFNFNPSMDK